MAHATAAWRREPLAAKVPEVTFLFWVIKLLTAAGGEAVSDFLVPHGYLLTRRAALARGDDRLG